YLSITSLAENCKVSEATITRFCRGLGLSGYNAFKLALAQADRTTDLGDSSNSAEPVSSEDSISTICAKVHAANLLSLNESYALYDEEEMSKAISILSSSRRIYCFGQGGSMIMAMEAWARFSTASPNFVHICDSHMQASAIAMADSKDAILFFSYSGSTRDMCDTLQIASSRHVPVILITHFPKSAGAEFASVVLQCGYNESPLQSGSVAAKVGQLFLIDCLFYGYCSQKPDTCSAARSATAHAIANKLL
ncbi:MurR/RpiR family transcriptional regulator, partial [Blautia wexlerae]